MALGRDHILPARGELGGALAVADRGRAVCSFGLLALRSGRGLQFGNLGIEDGAIPKGSSTCWWRHHDTDGSDSAIYLSGKRIAVVVVTRACAQRLDRANEGREEKGSSPFWICGRGGRFGLWSGFSLRKRTL